MRFMVTCASGDMSQYVDQFDFVIEPDETGETCYYIDFSSLEELMAFVLGTVQIVMIGDSIVIYDDYIE